MSSAKQKRIENERYPHVKRNWIKAIKAIRNGGELQKRIYLTEHPQGRDAPQKRQRIAQNAGGYLKHPDPKHWIDERTEEYGSSRKSGFSGGSSSDRLTEEQENEIAENIYDWWISGKSYTRWYAEKFQQMKFDFGEEL